MWMLQERESQGHLKRKYPTSMAGIVAEYKGDYDIIIAGQIPLHYGIRLSEPLYTILDTDFSMCSIKKPPFKSDRNRPGQKNAFTP